MFVQLYFDMYTDTLKKAELPTTYYSYKSVAPGRKRKIGRNCGLWWLKERVLFLEAELKRQEQR